MSYGVLKKAAVDVVDDFSSKDIKAAYFPSAGNMQKYSAKTKLESIELTAPVRSVMPPRVNKVFSKLYGKKWADVSAFETVKPKTIGDFIKLCAEHAGEKLPDGEPT